MEIRDSGRRKQEKSRATVSKSVESIRKRDKLGKTRIEPKSETCSKKAALKTNERHVRVDTEVRCKIASVLKLSTG